MRLQHFYLLRVTGCDHGTYSEIGAQRSQAVQRDAGAVKADRVLDGLMGRQIHRPANAADMGNPAFILLVYGEK
ncbi:hypothetical protein, partial [Chitinimonas sp.]|uniref:hypothetical protein n=1 Tax=Chitinimonas sp. TaxID=1934313 RepID=UPI0035B46C12